MIRKVRSFLALVLLVAALFGGCAETQEPAVETPPLNPRDTVGSIAKYLAKEAVPVRGIGIVACLAGTGSSECPPEIRAELEKYIWQQIPDAGSVNPKLVISSQDTAVVEITGVIGAMSTTSDRFDVAVRPLSSTQTTSLDGGCLYTAELKERSRLSTVNQFSRFSKTLATAEGPVFSSSTGDSESPQWQVLGGGKPKQNNSARLILSTPDFTASSVIRNRVNERFGSKTATCISDGEITLSFPVRYLDQRERFLEMVKSLKIGNSPEIKSEYASEMIKQILAKTDSEQAEIALEGIGKPALDPLSALLEHPDPEVQFHAARCMLNIGDRRPLPVLRAVVKDRGNPYRLDAVRVIGLSAKRRDAMPILESVLGDSNVKVRLEAYEMLLRLNSHVISRRRISNGNILVDNIVCSGPKMIYVYRQGEPRIALFGSPLRCENDIFIQSSKRGVTINSSPDDDRVSVSRTDPKSPRVIGPLTSSKDLGILIQTLGERPDMKSSDAVRLGLAIPYSDIIGILESMCSQGAVLAQYVEGPAAQPEPVLQENPPK